MKRKLFSVLLVLVLVLTLGLVTATPVAAEGESVFTVTSGTYTTTPDGDGTVSAGIAANLTGTWGDPAVIGDFIATGTGSLYNRMETPIGTTATIDVSGTLSADLIEFAGTALKTEGENFTPDDVWDIAGPITISPDGSFVAALTGLVTFGEIDYPVDLVITDGSMVRPIINEGTAVSFLTIQAAIDAAVPNDIINVAVGTYSEDLVIPDTKTGLELVGAEGAVIKGVSLSQWGVNTLPNIEILADGVKIHGFTIQGPEPAPPLFAAGMIIGAPNVEIYDNAFEVNNASDVSTDDIGQGIVTYNKLAKPGVDISGLSIHDNTFTHRGEGIHGYEGIYVNCDAGTGSISIVDNVFTGDIIRGITVERSIATISGNSLVATAGLAWTGVLVMNVGSAEAQDSVSVTGNTITGFDNGIKIGGTGKVLTNISVTDNTIQGNTTGVLVRSSAGGVVVNNNDIIDNIPFGVVNTDAATTLDATMNWWGTTDAGAIASMVSGDVDYNPWLTQTSVVLTGEGAVPAITTIAATDVLLYSATLQGDLTDMGGADSVNLFFEWKIEGGTYAEVIADPSAATAVPASFTFDLAGLTHDTTYYFRAKATVDPLIVYGNELSFTTVAETIGISVDETLIDFGRIPLGQPSPSVPVTVSNTGDVSVDLDASLAYISDPDVYTTGLTIDNLLVSEWGVTSAVTVAIGADTGALPLVLTVPLETEPGTYTATLVFWAEATPTP